MNKSVEYKLDLDLIVKLFGIDKNALALNPSKKMSILPYGTKSIASELNNEKAVHTGVIRKVSGVSYSAVIDEATLLIKICEKVETNLSQEMRSIIKSLYIKDGELIKFHPRLFSYGGKEKSIVNNISNYFVEHLFDQELVDRLKKVMDCPTGHIMETLILESLPSFTVVDNQKSDSEFMLIPKLHELFKRDFLFICSDAQLFVENSQRLIELYLFLLCTQTVFMVKNGFCGTNDLQPLYFFVEWEQISKSRQGYKQGWKMVEMKSEDLFAYTNLLQALNMTVNTDFRANFMGIKAALELMSVDELNEFNMTLNIVNEKIRSMLHLPDEGTLTNSFDPYISIAQLLETFKQAKDQGTSGRGTAFEKYQNNIKEIAKIQFLKPKGQLGSTLCLNEEWVIFLTKLCMGETKKIRLNDLWTEMERRSIHFDKYTKENIIAYYERINILEKKSDSGDAQYVRIL